MELAQPCDGPVAEPRASPHQAHSMLNPLGATDSTSRYPNLGQTKDNSHESDHWPWMAEIMSCPFAEPESREGLSGSALGKGFLLVHSRGEGQASDKKEWGSTWVSMKLGHSHQDPCKCSRQTRLVAGRKESMLEKLGEKPGLWHTVLW